MRSAARAFYATFLDHNETPSLEVLRRVPVTVVTATHDRLTPAAHGRRIAEQIGANAELVVVPGAGHSVHLTRTDVVDRALLDGRPVDSPCARARGTVIDSTPPRLQ